MKPNEKKYIFTDDIDYTKTSNDSVWGSEEDLTKKVLLKNVKKGNWLNLCAGDGRFNNLLLANADSVTALDIDEGPLEKLYRISPQELKSKLSIKTHNITETFPFPDNSFDGIFCSGTLHLFPKDILIKIFGEIDRVLKHNGKIVIDFATDIKRQYDDGSLWIVENEPNYKLDEALTILKELFKNYNSEFINDVCLPELVVLDDKQYMFSCNYVLISASKK
ncbi:MAG: class I SAM-dependent methyltransferase [Candidatus Gracilibacteria bacterium]|nr:class I SAM-dependent methyltransferase [Candidatus Gracilibacteria bacterium]